MRGMTRLSLTCTFAVVAAVVLAAPAGAKEFGPGDLRLCNRERCAAVEKPSSLEAFGALIYVGARPAAMPPVKLGAESFELRFRNGYVAGIIARGERDRFLSYGVYLGRFRRGAWYRVPARLATDLRRLTAGLEPLRVTPATLRRSR
jgi:hypothetical protein